jgi:hypothetical protein
MPVVSNTSLRVLISAARDCFLPENGPCQLISYGRSVETGVLRSQYVIQRIVWSVKSKLASREGAFPRG